MVNIIWPPNECTIKHVEKDFLKYANEKTGDTIAVIKTA